MTVEGARSFERPDSLGAALDLLGRASTSMAVLAGGTDLYPTLTTESSWDAAVPRDILDITGIGELSRIEEQDDAYRLGCLVTWSQLIHASLPSWFAALQGAGTEVGGVQIQNRATVAGNVCNASPAADGIPALLALGAELELASRRGLRRVPIADFVTGNRQTGRAADELVTAVRVPKHNEGTRSTFLKLGARRHLVISIVMVAALIEPDEAGRIAQARVAVGACSPVARRLPELEGRLLGAPIDGALATLAEPPSDLDALSPIDDVRASAAYRSRAARILTRRALERLGEASA